MLSFVILELKTSVPCHTPRMLQIESQRYSVWVMQSVQLSLDGVLGFVFSYHTFFSVLINEDLVSTVENKIRFLRIE